MKHLRLKLFGISLLATLAIFVYSFSKHSNPLTVEHIQSAELDIQKTINSIPINLVDGNVYTFLYSSDYKYRVSFGLQSVSNPVESINDDYTYKEIKGYHMANICFTRRTSELEANSALYKALNESNMINSNYFYIACPMFAEDKLIGYVSAVVEKIDIGLVSNILAVKYAAKVAERKIVSLWL